MRHGKSDWATSIGRDHERLLNERGRLAAARMGRLMVERDVVPDLVVSSTAARTRETTELVVGVFDAAPSVEFDRALYLTDPVSAMARVSDAAAAVDALVAEAAQAAGAAGAVASAARTVLLVNHEPTCSGLVSRLTGAAAPRFPTATVACIELAIDDWSALRAGTGRLAWLARPKELGE